MIPLPDDSIIDKLLSWQKNPETEQEEILCKFKNASYASARWIPVDEVAQTKNGKTRLKRFFEKGIFDQWSADEPFNPKFLEVTIFCV